MNFQSVTDAIFETYKDGIFFDQSLKQIIEAKSVLFASLPHHHDFYHHGYVKYLKSFLPHVDKICLITSGSRFDLIKIFTYWPEFVPLLDKNLKFYKWLSVQAKHKDHDSDKLAEWKYQCLFQDQVLIDLYENNVTDVKSWIIDRLKNDPAWRTYLHDLGADDRQRLKFYINKPQYFDIPEVVFTASQSFRLMTSYNQLWPNEKIEKILMG